MNHRLTPYLLSAPAAALLLGLLAGPLLLLVRVSLYEPAQGHGFFIPETWVLTNFASVTDGYGLSLLGFTGMFGAAVALGTVLLAYPIALFIRALSPLWRRVALAAVLLPKLACVLVILFGLQQLLGNAGPVNRILLATGATAESLPLVRNRFGALAGEVYLVLPYTILVLLAQLLGIDPNLESAARGLGASRWQAFLRVTLPLSAPGLVLAGQLGLMWGLGAFLGPLLLGGPGEMTLAVEIHRQAFEYSRWPRAAAAAVLLAATVLGCLAGYAFLGRLVRRRVP
jgi:ABC-type spermidine/putrescine transport system permease subunit I